MIPVTRPFLPSRSAVEKYLDGIYERKWLTNNGPLAIELKNRLEDYLGVSNLLLVANGTLALQVAYRSFDIQHEAVTTPFSFIATASSLKWEKISPKFSDINRKSLNLCAFKAADSISKQTQAIVPVHVYGNPCDVDALDLLGISKGIKVIYDAAHAFGINIDGESVLKRGDASILSFHATKVLHTVEGGAVVFSREDDYEYAKDLINFGIDGRGCINKTGINGKISEVHAGFGLAMLDHIDEILAKRIEIFEYYRDALSCYVEMPEWHRSANINGAYFPIITENESVAVGLLEELKNYGIGARRYFYPSLDSLEFLNSNSRKCEISQFVAERVVCLPLFPELQCKDVQRIVDIVIRVIEKRSVQ